MTELDKIVEPGPVRDLISQLVYYRYTYVNKNKPYPRDYLAECLQLLLQDWEDSQKKLKEAVNASGKAYEGFKALKCSSEELNNVIRNYAAEARRTGTIGKEFLILMDVYDAYNQARELADKYGECHKEVISKLESSLSKLNEILDIHDSMMLEMEEVKETYLVPHLMRDLTMMRHAFLELRNKLVEIMTSIERGEEIRSLLPLEWVMVGF